MVTRLAPTPSGFLHVGNVFNMLLTWWWAKSQGATLALRIDDHDQPRCRPEYLEDIFFTLDWLGITTDVGPATAAEQLSLHAERQSAYKAALEQLLGQGKAYSCRCSRAQLAAAASTACVGRCRQENIGAHLPDHAIRLLTTTDDRQVELTDLAGQQHQVQLFPEMEDFVVWRKDGIASYQLSSLVDDVNLATTHIVRGKDLWQSSGAQLLLAEKLGLRQFQGVRFHHHSLVAPGGEKLSKSAGAQAAPLRENWTKQRIFREFGQWMELPQGRATIEKAADLLNFSLALT